MENKRRINTQCEFETTFNSADICKAINWDDYIDYINKTLDSSIIDSNRKSTYNSDKYGQLDIICDINELFLYRGNAQIKITIYDDGHTTEEDWYDYMKDDKGLMEHLANQLSDYIEEINKNLDILYPKDSIVLYQDEHLYLQIDTRLTNKNPEFIPIQINDFVDTDIIQDMLYVE